MSIHNKAPIATPYKPPLQIFTSSISRRSTGSSVPCSESPCRLCPCRFQAFRLFIVENRGVSLISFSFSFFFFFFFFLSLAGFLAFFRVVLLSYTNDMRDFFFRFPFLSSSIMFHQGLPCFPHAVPHTSQAKYARSRLGRRWCQIRPSDWRSGTRTMDTRPLRACVVQHNYGVRLYKRETWTRGEFDQKPMTYRDVPCSLFWCVVQDGG